MEILIIVFVMMIALEEPAPKVDHYKSCMEKINNDKKCLDLAIMALEHEMHMSDMRRANTVNAFNNLGQTIKDTASIQPYQNPYKPNVTCVTKWDPVFKYQKTECN